MWPPSLQGTHKGRPYMAPSLQGTHKGCPYMPPSLQGTHKGCPYMATCLLYHSPMLSLGLLLLLGAPQVQIQASSQEIRPVRVAATAFGMPVEIEVRDLPREAARTSIQSALDEIAEVERFTRPDTLNAAAGQGPQAIDSRLMPLLVRAQEFCFWSEGAHGPLGRDLYEAWGLRGSGPAGSPDPERLESAKAVARCEALRLEPAKGTAELAEGARLDLGGFAEGHAVDRAVEVLQRFRREFPGHAFNADVTQKLAVALEAAGRRDEAALEYENVAAIAALGPDVHREALRKAAELFA